MLTSIFFFFNDTATTEIYTLSLHDALPIFETIAEAISHQKERTLRDPCGLEHRIVGGIVLLLNRGATYLDRKSTRLNSSHSQISYAVFCLKKKNRQT